MDSHNKIIRTEEENDYKENMPKKKVEAVIELNCIYVEEWKRIFYSICTLLTYFKLDSHQKANKKMIDNHLHN